MSSLLDDLTDHLLRARGVLDVAQALEALVGERADRLVLYRSRRQSLRQVRAVGFPEDAVPPGVPAQPGPVWQALSERTPVRDGGAVVLPLMGSEGVVGVLQLEGASGPPELWSRVADLAGAALDRALEHDRSRLDGELLRASLPLLEDGLIVATPDGELLHYSRSLERMTGWAEEQVRAHGWTNLVYPDPVERAEVQQGLAALLLGRPSRGTERTLARADGTELTAAIWSELLPDPAGGAPALLGIIRDVTSSREARRRAVREESFAQLGQMAAGIAHEFNNLLCAITGHADLMQLSERLDPTVARHAETIVDAARNGARLSEQLLAFSGVSNPRPLPVDPFAEARKAADLVRAALPSGIALVLEPADEDVPRIEADLPQLHQVIVNLLVNARDALGDHGRIRLEVRRRPLPQDVRYRAPHAPAAGSEMVCIAVQDDGPGFTPDALDHLFEPFYTSKSAGHGLGLPAARGIVAAHGGALHVVNAPGARVETWWPISRRPEVELERLAPQAETTGQRVWVLDDQEQILEFSKVSLDAQGFRVDTWSSEDALVRAAQRTSTPPDVLVLDVVMSQGGGPRVLPELRRVGIRAPVVWTSGFTPDSLELPEPEHFLQKPYTGGDLARAVRRALSGVTP